jgi:hypothetical protein
MFSLSWRKPISGTSNKEELGDALSAPRFGESIAHVDISGVAVK